MVVIFWSAAITAGAFVILTAGILYALRSALGKLAQLQASAAAAQDDLHKLTTELSGLVKPAEDTIRAAHRQLQSAESLFTAAGQIGGAIAHTTSAIEQVTSVLSDAAEKHAKRASTKRQAGEAMEWAELGMTAWQLWQSSRREAARTGAEHADVSSAYPKWSRDE
ncbi:hypothetical protein D3C78_1310240 [compost metagenome]